MSEKLAATINIYLPAGHDMDWCFETDFIGRFIIDSEVHTVIKFLGDEGCIPDGLDFQNLATVIRLSEGAHWLDRLLSVQIEYQGVLGGKVPIEFSSNDN